MRYSTPPPGLERLRTQQKAKLRAIPQQQRSGQLSRQIEIYLLQTEKARFEQEAQKLADRQATLQARLTLIDQQLAQLAQPQAPPAQKPAAAKSTSARRTATRRKK